MSEQDMLAKWTHWSAEQYLRPLVDHHTSKDIHSGAHSEPQAVASHTVDALEMKALITHGAQAAHLTINIEGTLHRRPQSGCRAHLPLPVVCRGFVVLLVPLEVS